MRFGASNTKTDTQKWRFYIAIGTIVFVFILRYSNWHFITKFLIAFPLFINLLFDIYYLINIKSPLSSLTFDESSLIINRTNKKSKRVQLSYLKYSIRKRKFDKHKTEIELKLKKGLRYKTIERLHIKNWNTIFEIEQELKKCKVERVEWKPQTLWGKYWGIFIDLFFVTIADGDLGMTEYQEKSIHENTENPIKKQTK